MNHRLTTVLDALPAMSAVVPAAAEQPYPWDLETGRELVIIGTAVLLAPAVVGLDLPPLLVPHPELGCGLD